MTISAFAPAILFLFGNHKRTRIIVLLHGIFALSAVAKAVSTDDNKENVKILKWIPMFILIMGNIFWIGNRNLQLVFEKNLATNKLNKKF